MIIPLKDDMVSNLSQRLKPAILAIAICLLAIYCVGDNDLYFLPAIAISLVTVMASRELHSIISLNGLDSEWKLNLAAALIPQMTLWWFGAAQGWILLLGMFLAVILPAIWLMYHSIKDHSLISIFFHAFYLGAPIMLIYSQVLPQSSFLLSQTRFDLVLWLCVVKGTDIGGYFIGKFWGRMRMCTHISPGKTWEGFLGGVLLAQILGFSLYLFNPIEGGLHSCFSLSFIFFALSASAQVGDLLESYLKRMAGVKDSGSVPGLGGILDMIDSLLLSAVVFWIFKQAAWL
jgi:phosphatidate cytidylyltransferase